MYYTYHVIYFASVFILIWIASRHFSFGRLALLAGLPSLIAPIAVRVYGYQYVEGYGHDLQGYEPLSFGLHVALIFGFNLIFIGGIFGGKALRARYWGAGRLR